MKPMEQSEVFLQHHALPCFLADVETSRIIFSNDKMKNLLGEKRNYIGELFYEVMSDDIYQTDGTYKKNIPIFQWEKNVFHKTRIYNSHLGAKFDCSVYLIELMKKTYLFCEYVPFDHKQSENYNLELALAKSVHIIQKGEDVISNFLHLLSEFYASERCNIYKIDIEHQSIHLTHNWHFLEGLTVTYDIGEKMDVLPILQWLHSRNSVGIVEASKNQIDVHPVALEMLDCFQQDNLVISVLEDENGNITGGIGVFNRKDIATDYSFLQAVTEFVKQELSKESLSASVENIVYVDLLSGFYRRPYYTMVVETLQLSPPPTMGVIFANVNSLKTINEQFGYAKGDSYISKVADILRNHFHTDFYRISGDEFVSLILGISKDDLEVQVGTLMDSLSTEEKHCFSLGYAWGKDRYEIQALVQEADNMMYINKQEYYHSSPFGMENINNNALVELLTALKENEFTVYLQPQVRLSDGEIHGAEALIRRFSSVTGEVIFPDQFIPLYEQKSVIRHIDVFVLEEVCKFLYQCRKNGRKLLQISVNLSRVTLQEYGIVRTIKKICDDYDVPTNYIVIEVTERMGLVENNVASSLIREFHKLGFRISLDDFGCAYSNIITLAQVDIDEVKLDKSLVDDITINHKNKVLVESVIKMCDALGDNFTLAEGIETVEQATLLDKLHCKLGQGYYYSKPIPLDDFKKKYVI